MSSASTQSRGRLKLGPNGGTVTDPPRPLLLGYLSRHLLISDADFAMTLDQLDHFAKSQDYALAAVYVEQAETAPAAFEALVDAVNRGEVGAVVLPSILHFAVLGAPTRFKAYFEHATGARVLVATQPPHRLVGPDKHIARTE